MSPLAFITELMGITFYCHLDRLFDDVLADEPEARDRLRELLYEIMVDEIAHIGQRRNFCGNLGVRAATWMIKPLFKAFFADLPESRLLFDVPQMIRDAQAFNYSGIPQQVMDRSWVPSYLRAEAQDLESRPS
jgi:hypothetical protein